MISLTNPTGRNTKAHIVTIGGNEYFFSYETCIAFRGHSNLSGRVLVRIDNSWGPTTGRHFRELGCREFKVVGQDEFDEIIEDSTAS